MEFEQEVARRLRDVPALSGRSIELVKVPYDFSSPTTAGLYRTSGAFVKVLRPYRHWPLVDLLPEDFRQLALATDLWRYEADVYLDGLSRSLPSGLRLPQLLGVESVDDRLILVLEDVRPATVQWDHQRYGRAAELLGRLSARLTAYDALPAVAFRAPGQLIRTLYTFVQRFAHPVLLNPETWKHPLLANDRDLLDELVGLAARMPALMGELAQRPQLMSHGDACPQNLLVPADRPDTFVAIDWTLSGLLPAGDDLGQLLIGRVHSAELAPAELGVLRELTVERYHAGLVAEGRADVTPEDVRAGLDASLLVRSAFLSVPVERLTEPATPEFEEHVAGRLQLTRRLLELSGGDQ
ncbi:phosphotransferase [Kribbella sp. CA-253562]|uniref:phosphotransferase n=1 Tax=Kribbella sp. CA-253562 TaxID=3239942 RepID=UPI003D8A7948